MRASIRQRWARGRAASICFARLRRGRLLADRLGGGRRIGGREGVVDFLVKCRLFGLLRGVRGTADRPIGIAASPLHLGLVHVRLLADRQKNACFRLKFLRRGTHYRLSRYDTGRNVGASSDCSTKPEARAALT